MNKVTLALTLALCLSFGSLALAQQPPAPQGQSGQVKVEPKAKKAKKVYRGDDLGDLHEGAKKYGVDTSKPESLKGKDVAGEMAKRVKL